jgi:iron(III) transport system substrate-binding protein
MTSPLRFAATALALAFAGTAAQAAEVNLYSARQNQLIKPVLERFTQETGIKVNVLNAGEAQLLERLKAEGADGPADVLLTTDIVHLHNARTAGVLAPLKSAELEKNIPSHFREADGRWFAMSARARVIFYAKDRVKPSDLSTYEDLANPKWKGKICVRPSTHPYNQTLMASIIAANGPEKAEQWAKGVTDNLARKPQGGDRDQIKGAAAGECDLAIANTYYLGGLITSEKAEDREVASKVALFWPNQDGRGAHMNVSGAGMTISAKNKAQAQKLIEFMSGPEAQKMLAEGNHEFPVSPTAKPSPVVQSWGEFRAEKVNVAKLGENIPEAVKIFDRVGWR